MKPALVIVTNGRAPHLGDPIHATRTVCGLVIGHRWIVLTKPTRAICRSCERMRSSAEEAFELAMRNGRAAS